MQSLALDVNVRSEEGAGVEIRDEDDDLLRAAEELGIDLSGVRATDGQAADETEEKQEAEDRKSTRLNSSHANISYAVFCLKKKKKHEAVCHSKSRHKPRNTI